MICRNRIRVPFTWDYFSRHFEKRFVSRLVKNAGKMGIDSLDCESITLLAEQIFEENVSYIVDAQSQSHYLMTSYVLAAYRQLCSLGISKVQSMDLLERCFKSVGAFWIKWLVRIGLFLHRDKLKFFTKSIASRSDRAYGKSFQIIHENHAEGGFVAKVKRCGYHDFFLRNNAEELTRVLCRWDNNWSDEIQPEKHHIRFVRPVTIAQGEKECRFEFHILNQ